MRRSRSLVVAAVALGACVARDARIGAPVPLGAWLDARPRGAPGNGHAGLSGRQSRAPGKGQDKGRATREETGGRGRRPINLEAALRLVGAGALEIELARSRAREAAALADGEAARSLPAVSPTLDLFRHEGRIQETAGQFLEVDKQRAFAGASVDLVFNPGEAIYRSLAARQRARAATENIDGVANESLAKAAELYFRLVASQARIQIGEDALRAARELLEVETSRLELGVGLAASVARARARVAETEGQLELARSLSQAESARLVELLVLDPALFLVPDQRDARVPIELLEGSLAELLHRAEEHRPELEAARAELRASEAEAAYTGSAWWMPELSVGASIGGSGATPGKFEDREDYHASVRWRFDFGMTSRHAAAKERSSQARLRVAAVRQQIASSVVRSRSKVLAGKARMRAARQEVEAAQQSLALIRTRREEGVDLLLEELDAQSALTRARTALVIAVAEHNAAQYALLAAVGG